MALKLLRLQVEYSKLRGSVAGDDVDVTTHDFVIDDPTWPDAGGAGFTHNYAQLETDFRTFWSSLVGSAPSRIGSGVTPVNFKWYRQDNGELPFGPASRITATAAIPGAGALLPPQMASTITEETQFRKHWGRFYVPGISVGNIAADGSLISAAVTHLQTAAKTMYDSWRTRGVHPIVLGSVPTGTTSIYGFPISALIGGTIYRWLSGSLQATDRVTVGWPVTRLHVDDVLDVIRRRRFNTALIRSYSAVFP